MLRETKNLIKRITIEVTHPTIMSLIVVACCCLSLWPMRDDAGFLVCLSYCFFAYISSKHFAETLRFARNLFDDWWKRIFAFVVYIYFNFSLYGLVYLESDGMTGFKLNRALYPVVAIIWVTPLYLGMIYGVAKLLNTKKYTNKGLAIGKKTAAFVVLMLHYGLWLFAFNPCISSSDSCGLFDQAHRMLTNPMANWHPPFYAIVLSLLFKIWDSASFVIMVQCLAFSILIIRMTDYLLRVGCKPFICVSTYLVLGFSFNNVIQMVTLWKDIPYMISITWLTYLLAQFLMGNGEVEKSWYLRFVIAMVFTALFRQNGILPAMAVALLISIDVLRRKKYLALIAVMVFCVIVIVIQGPVYSFYKVESRPGLKFFALANDIVGTYYAVENPSNDVVKMVNEITENNPDTFPYSSYNTMYNPDALGDYSVVDFMSIYIDTFLKHPRALATQFMRRNSPLWSIVRPQGELAGCINYTSECHLDYVIYEYPKRVPNCMTSTLAYITNKLTSVSLIYIFAWRTGFYTVLLLVVMLYLICKKKIEVILVFVPTIFNALALYVASGWPDYRYFWPMAIMTIFIVPFVNCYLSRDDLQLTQSEG